MGHFYFQFFGHFGPLTLAPFGLFAFLLPLRQFLACVRFKIFNRTYLCGLLTYILEVQPDLLYSVRPHLRHISHFLHFWLFLKSFGANFCVMIRFKNIFGTYYPVILFLVWLFFGSSGYYFWFLRAIFGVGVSFKNIFGTY